MGRLGRRIWRRAVVTVLGWHERTRQRQALVALDRRQLRDVGLTPADVARETNKTFWQL